MISRIESFFRRMRKRLSRSEWIVRLFGLPCDSADAIRSGVVMIQVDGLAMSQLEKAIARGKMPFLADLIRRQGHALRPFYSGLPSTTPAVQAEIFYGEKTAIPAFSFLDRAAKRRHVMFDADSADYVVDWIRQKQLRQKGRDPGFGDAEPEGFGLLSGGTAYGDIYTGGSEEARYCIQNLSLESIIQSASLIKLLLLLTIYLPKIVRVLLLAVLELGLAVVDFFRGVYARRDVFREFKFVPSRVGACIMLRELIRFRVKMDLARGVPIIHANLMGYDEQSHRRGPSSAFAHWSLKGIDGVIRDIYRSARRSDCRDYKFLIYSDHGQEEVVSYERRHGKWVGYAVREALSGETPMDDIPVEGHYESGGESRHLRGRGLLLAGRNRPPDLPLEVDCAEKIQVMALGPIGHIYLPFQASDESKAAMADALADRAAIPLTLYVAEDGIKARNASGRHDFSADPAPVLGADHPFLDRVAEDLERLCRHPNAGDLVICGWSAEGPPITFPVENGAHGGPGREETRGFALLPPDAEKADVLRGLDLGRIARQLLAGRAACAWPSVAGRPGDTLRVVTYNIHSCRSMDGRVFPERVARLIGNLKADVVALQEVDVYRTRTGRRHQARMIAEALDMRYRFFPVVENGDGGYGLAVLSRHPFSRILCDWFPVMPGNKKREERGVIWAVIDTPAGPLHLFNTHLGLNPKERRFQATCLMGRSWLRAVPEGEPVVMCGDFNAGPRSPTYRLITERLRDVRKGFEDDPKAIRPTFFSRNPLFRIDHIFASQELRALKVRVPRSHDFQVASDHLPVCADLRVIQSAGGE